MRNNWVLCDIYIKKIFMKKKVIKLNETDIERLVKKIIREEDDTMQPKEGQPKEKVEKTTTVTRHPAYPIIDKLESHLDELKANFKREIANKVSGTDGYHSEIDKFSEDFGKFNVKVANLKSKINDYEIESKESKKRAYEERKKSYMAHHNQRKNNAAKNGRNYSY